VLLDYRKAKVELAELIGNGEFGMTVLMTVNAPKRRRIMTESMEEFEAARHQLRLAIFALGQEAGSSISEIE
jgi:hypothetical protein